MPRLAAREAGYPIDSRWGLAALLTPLLGAFVGAGLAAGLGGGGWRVGALAGAASQVAAIPSYLEQVAGLLEVGYLMDAAFLTAVLWGYLSMAMVVGAAVSIWVRREPPPAVTPPAASALVVGGLLLLATGVTALTVPGVGWHNGLALAFGAAFQFWPVVCGGRGALRQAAVPLLIGSLGVATFAAAFVAFARFV